MYRTWQNVFSQVYLWQGFAFGLEVKRPTLIRCIKVQYFINWHSSWNHTKNAYRSNSHRLKVRQTRIQITEGFGVIWSAAPEAYKSTKFHWYIVESSYPISIFSRRLWAGRHTDILATTFLAKYSTSYVTYITTPARYNAWLPQRFSCRTAALLASAINRLGYIKGHNVSIITLSIS